MTEKGHEETGRGRYVTARVRVVIAGVVGILAYGVMAVITPWQVAVLIGWDVMAAVFLAWAWWTIRGSDGGDTARLARVEDPSRPLADVVLVSASLASLPGIGFALFKASSEPSLARAVIIGVAVGTVALSWLLVQSVYADLYYAAESGIDFHDDRAPDYGDFAYVAFTIGMTFQVSDIDIISRRIRMAALRHALLSYLFGIAVIATTINAVAGLLNH